MVNPFEQPENVRVGTLAKSLAMTAAGMIAWKIMLERPIKKKVEPYIHAGIATLLDETLKFW